MGVAIHGGTSPGSAGRIDLTDQMKSYTGHFLVYGHDLELTMKYPRGEGSEKPGCFSSGSGVAANFWYSLAFMPSVMVLFSFWGIIKYLEYSRDYILVGANMAGPFPQNVIMYLT